VKRQVKFALLLFLLAGVTAVLKADCPAYTNCPMDGSVGIKSGKSTYSNGVLLEQYYHDDATGQNRHTWWVRCN